VSRELAANFGISPGVLRSLPLEAGAHDDRDRLIAEFRRIHLAGWLTSRRFDAAGRIIPCTAQNCGGYTLEVELGVRPSGKAEPDFLGWEVKQFTVPSFERPSGVLTLMTPEPDGGTYKSKGAGAFVRRFGYADKSGEPDRLNFGGIHRVGVVTGITGLRLDVRGYDRSRSKISDVCGGVCLVAKSGEVAASWSFSKLIEHWKVKHAQTVFAMSQRDGKPTVRYRYGPRIYLGKGADFVTVLDAFASGQIYYDPALKLEKASTNQAALKRRSQFRIRFSDVSGLYRQYEAVELV
jgi:hypothetical protein